MDVDFSSQDYFRNPAAAITKLRSAGSVVEVRFPIIVLRPSPRFATAYPRSGTIEVSGVNPNFSAPLRRSHRVVILDMSIPALVGGGSWHFRAPG
jgi:hypothetical protein